MIKESDPHPPEQGQVSCAATAAEAVETRELAVELLLFAAAQAFTAMAAVAAPSRIGALLAQFASLPMAWRLTGVLAGVVHLAVGRCHDHGAIYQQVVVAGYVILAVPFGLLFLAGLVVFFSG